MARPEDTRQGSGEDPARRDRRAAAFAAELALAWRTELACLWERPEAESEVPGAAAFKGRVVALRQLAAREGVDAAAIQGLTQGLYGAAQALKQDARVRRWMAETAIRGEAGAREASKPRTADGFRSSQAPAPKPQAGGLAVVRELLQDVGPRLAAVRVALAADPTRDPGWGALAGELKLQVPALAVALASQPGAAAIARQALQHFDAAQAALGGAAPERLRGVVMPLNQLHVAFRDVPALARLFPPPRTRALPAVPAGRLTGPIAPPSRSVTGPASRPVAPPKPAPGARGTGQLPGAVGGPAVTRPATSSLAPGVPRPATSSLAPNTPRPATSSLAPDVHIPAAGANRVPTGRLSLPQVQAAEAPVPEASAPASPPGSPAPTQPDAAGAETPPSAVPAPTAAPEPIEAAPAAPLTPAEVSKRRMAAIAGYLKDPEADPLLRDPAVIFRLVSDEHAYQHDQVAHLRMLLALLPPTADPARRTALTTESAGCAKRQRQLYELLKRITARGRPP